LLTLLTLLSVLIGIGAGLRFRAGVLPVLTVLNSGMILAEGWLRGAESATVLLRVVFGAFALQAGYVLGLWIEQAWRQKD
jgi:hypothetical protein